MINTNTNIIPITLLSKQLKIQMLNHKVLEEKDSCPTHKPSLMIILKLVSYCALLDDPRDDCKCTHNNNTALTSQQYFTYIVSIVIVC